MLTQFLQNLAFIKNTVYIFSLCRISRKKSPNILNFLNNVWRHRSWEKGNVLVWVWQFQSIFYITSYSKTELALIIWSLYPLWKTGDLLPAKTACSRYILPDDAAVDRPVGCPLLYHHRGRGRFRHRQVLHQVRPSLPLVSGTDILAW